MKTLVLSSLISNCRPMNSNPEQPSSLRSLEKEMLSIISGKGDIKWRKTAGEMLDVDYAVLIPRSLANKLMDTLEKTVEYYSGDLTKVKVFGKWHQIPRQQVAYGDLGLKYTFSGVTIEAKPWFPLLSMMRHFVEEVTGYKYNFVLLNRYRDGNDHIGEHRDDEKDLDKSTPIASLSLGQERDFILKHRDARLKGKLKRNIAPSKYKIELKGNVHPKIQAQRKEPCALHESLRKKLDELEKANIIEKEEKPTN